MQKYNRMLCMSLQALLFAGSLTAHAAESVQSVTKTSTQNDITIAIQTTIANEDDQPKPRQTASVEAKALRMQKGLFRIYRSTLLKKTYQHVIYPESAIDKNQQGNVILRIIVTRSGKVNSIDFDSRANFNSLNKAAKRAVNQAKPYPAAPKKLEGEAFEILMPIRFRLAN